MARKAARSQTKLFQDKNLLIYGDNLKVLRNPMLFVDESVDLVYLDPPFKPTEKYNVLFRPRKDTGGAAQVRAFEDAWEWGEAAKAAYHDTMENAPTPVRRTIEALKTVLDQKDVFAYLCMMAPRLVELHRVLRETGSLYLHCDPSASHYLKVLLDAVFGPENFRSEIIWKRSSAHSDTKQGRQVHGHVHDVVLFYTKSSSWTWNPVYTEYTKEYLESEYRHKTADGRYYKETDLTAAKPGGDTAYEWRVKRKTGSAERWQPDLEDEYLTPKPDFEYLGVKPYSGRYWAYSKANLVDFAKQGKLIHRKTGMPRLMQFANEMPGVALQDVWTDVPPVAAKAAEREGYPTQKPLTLLERIIMTSSDEGDMVLDPFCGCGSTIAAAERLGRRWTGIDVAHDAIRIIRGRLTRGGLSEKHDYEVWGEPESVADAIQLAEEDKYQFQWWAVRRLGGREISYRKGPDERVDGRLVLRSERLGDRLPEAIISVKAGRKSGPNHVSELRGVIEREGAEIGVLVTRGPATKAMKLEADKAGEYTDGSKWYPRIQLLTAEDIINGRGVQYPAVMLKEKKPVQTKSSAQKRTARRTK